MRHMERDPQGARDSLRQIRFERNIENDIKEMFKSNGIALACNRYDILRVICVFIFFVFYIIS